MRRICSLIFGLAGMSAAHAAQPAPYVVAYSDAHPFSPGVVAFLTEAYGRIGLPIETKAFPPARSVEMANRGEVDAEASRVPDAMGEMKDLIAVPEPLGQSETFAFTTGAVISIDGWESLRPYRLCVVLGDLITMKRTAGMRRETTHDLASEFRMLQKGRCEVAIADGAAWLTIDSQHLGPFRMMDTPVQSFPVFHYVNRRHADLVQPLAQAFRDLQQEGFTQRLLAPYLAKVRDSQTRNSVMPPS